ncbi:Qat anti-phage system associated protein QatB [Pseudomonas abieticivorans]|uniref:Qat anti-phage system associated protein QatB n=1 Tax=Pseudomonas abieticivorans TaxID=2931382 RepID=UPI0032E04D48
MVPSWTPPLPPLPPEPPRPPSPPLDEPGDEDSPGQEDDPHGDIDADTPIPEVVPAAPVPLAPPARFIGARRGLGDYARNGDRGSLRRSLREYVRNGYGGAKTTTARFGGTAAIAGVFSSTLESLADPSAQASSTALDPVLWSGRSASEVMDALVEAVRPVDGTQDAEAERASIRGSLSDVLVRYPDADLLNLSADQRAFAIERFTAMDVFHRYELDLGKAVQEKASSATVAVRRLREIKDYIKECVSASFRKIAASGSRLTTGRISQVVTRALQDTFEVFEGYVE